MISGLPLNVALRRLRWYGKLLPLLKFTGGRDSRELYYQGILSQSLVALQVTTPPLYPVSSGANFSLFYCLSRAIIDLEVKSVLELGAGQTSLLLNSIKQCRPDLRVRTVETDEGWCKRISRRVSHEVVYSPLQEREVMGVAVKAYADMSFTGDQTYDMIVVDGPPGTRSHSRWAALEVLDKCLSDEYLVIFDDAERPGEQDTIRKFMERRDPGVRFAIIVAGKCQFLAFSSKYSSAAYF